MGTDLHFACCPVVVDKSSVHFCAEGDFVLSGDELQVFTDSAVRALSRPSN